MAVKWLDIMANHLGKWPGATCYFQLWSSQIHLVTWHYIAKNYSPTPFWALGSVACSKLTIWREQNIMWTKHYVIILHHHVTWECRKWIWLITKMKSWTTRPSPSLGEGLACETTQSYISAELCVVCVAKHHVYNNYNVPRALPIIQPWPMVCFSIKALAS